MLLPHTCKIWELFLNDVMSVYKKAQPNKNAITVALVLNKGTFNSLKNLCSFLSLS